ncbi:MAG: helix-turn-helix transcriptional regulator [Firmicutes bacterium]|nr:helix-turn-helix transcriptional regulator [Bacillota bacterium]
MQNNVILASFRTKNNLTQKDMADLLNIGLSTYKMYEAGILPMKLEELNFLSNYYNISLNYLLNVSKKNITNNFRRSIDYKYLKFSLRYFRRLHRLTQKDLAKEFNTSVYSIIKYEKDASTVNILYLYLFAKKFNISIDYLCGKSLKKEIA